MPLHARLGAHGGNISLFPTMTRTEGPDIDDEKLSREIRVPTMCENHPHCTSFAGYVRNLYNEDDFLQQQKLCSDCVIIFGTSTIGGRA